jgi:hypothetical protein
MHDSLLLCIARSRLYEVTKRQAAGYALFVSSGHIACYASKVTRRALVNKCDTLAVSDCRLCRLGGEAFIWVAGHSFGWRGIHLGGEACCTDRMGLSSRAGRLEDAGSVCFHHLHLMSCFRTWPLQNQLRLGGVQAGARRAHAQPQDDR